MFGGIVARTRLSNERKKMIRETGRIYDDTRHFSVRGHTVESASPRDPGEMSERRCFRLSQKLRRSHARPVINTV